MAARVFIAIGLWFFWSAFALAVITSGVAPIGNDGKPMKFFVGATPLAGPVNPIAPEASGNQAPVPEDTGHPMRNAAMGLAAAVALAAASKAIKDKVAAKDTSNPQQVSLSPTAKAAVTQPAVEIKTGKTP